MKEVWREPKALAVALGNFLKLVSTPTKVAFYPNGKDHFNFEQMVSEIVESS